MVLKDTATFQVPVVLIVYLFCAWNITTVEINSGVYLLKFAKCLYLIPMVGLVSSCLGLGSKNLVTESIMSSHQTVSGASKKIVLPSILDTSLSSLMT